MTIYDAYDKSIAYVRKGLIVQEAVYLTLTMDVDYEHDTQLMLLYWHDKHVAPFSGRGGYPK